MIGEFELYHGAALRDLIVSADFPLQIRADDDHGRINSYIVNDELGIYIKHSSSRLPPWQFVYSNDNLDELNRLSSILKKIWLFHVCGRDGVVAVRLEEFYLMNPVDAGTTSFVRVDRDRNTMYRLNGTDSKLPRPKARGLAAVIDDLRV